MRFRYSSLVTPPSVIDYHMDTGEWEIVKQEEIPSGYDITRYVSERIYATASDGKSVPISLVYKRDLDRDGNNPTLLYGYGAYGSAIDADFNSRRFSLLDRGFVFAIGHIRGGSDMGRAWYEDGKLFNKKNSFTDFIACAEHLIQEGYTSKEKLAIDRRLGRRTAGQRLPDDAPGPVQGGHRQGRICGRGHHDERPDHPAHGSRI